MTPRIFFRVVLLSMFSILAAPSLSGTAAAAGKKTEYTIIIKNHRFEPSVIEVPAGVRIKLVIDNQDASAEEFESHDLRREKVVAGKSRGIVWIGPLPKGEYTFVGEFHEKTAKGKLIAK